MKPYHSPGACSRVTLTTLEQVGAPYKGEIVDLALGEQHSRISGGQSARQKSPALVVVGRMLNENAAIVWWLGRSYPQGGLFPEAREEWVAGAAALRPALALGQVAPRRPRQPDARALGPGDPPRVKERGRQSPMERLGNAA